MSSFKDFLRWYNNENLVPYLETMQKIIDFYPDKDIVMLKLGRTVPNLGNISLRKSSDTNSIPSQKEIKSYNKKFEEVSLLAQLPFLQAKQLLMEHLFESLKFYANPLLG